MNKEKDFFKTCFNTVAGLEVKNESQAIAKEVVLSEIETLEQQCKNQKEVFDKLKEWINIVQQKKDNKHLEPFISTDELDELLDILKGVNND